MLDEIFALDLGEKYIKAAQCSQKGSLLSASNLGLFENPLNLYSTDLESDISKMGEIIRRVVNDSGIHRRDVNIVIPDSQSYLQIIEMPMMTEKELSSAIKYHADQFIPISIEKVGLDIEILSQDRAAKKLIVLIVAAANTVLRKVTDIAESAGLNPVSIESEGSSAIRLFSQLFYNKNPEKVPAPANKIEEAHLMINFGYTSTSLYLMSLTKSIPKSTHTFPLGLELFAKDIKANFSNMADEEAKRLLTTIGFSGQATSINIEKILLPPLAEFVNEVTKFITGASAKYNVNVTKILLYGDGSTLLGMVDKLNTYFQSKADYFNLIPFFQKNAVINSASSQMTLFIPGVGASLR